MRRVRALVPCLALPVALGACGPEETSRASPELGAVDFPTSCSEAAQPHLERGLLMLHHMLYPQAGEAFGEAVRAGEECAMGHWGVAMARFQPLWGSADIEGGRAPAERAVALEPPTERERLYARAVLAFYEDPDATHAERVRRWEAAMEELHRRFPEDPEAATLFALAHLSAAPDDSGHRARAREIVEEVHRRIPEHPGAIHYAIHVHDVDALAEEGTPYARAYRDLAPTIPHALHMPSHIYVRTGAWDEVIEWNRRSADAALEHPAGEHISLHYAHALDYLMYGRLQRGEDDGAREVLEELRGREGYEPHMASAYALAAVPARWHVERRDWIGAASLEPRVPERFDWNAYPAADAMTWFARGLGAARTGDTEAARAARERLAELEAAVRDADQPYWARRVQVQRRSVSAWIALAEGRTGEAVETMTAAADTAGTMQKHPITPGSLQPARELLGDLLMEVDRPGEALEAYEASLEVWPRRYRSLLGAARAADRSGDAEAARGYYEELAELAADAHPDREGATEARRRIGGA